MARAKKSWREKLLDAKDLPMLGRIEGRMTRRWGTGTMVVPAPIEVDGLMKQVAKGKLITIEEIRAALARKHRVTIACPLTTGIFAWIAAHAADEDQREGRSRVTPYWRTLKSKGELNPRYPGGIADLRRRLKAEGHRILQKGKRFFVDGYQDRLARLS